MSFKLKSISTVHRYQSDLDEDKGTDKAVTFLIRTFPRKEATYLRSLLRNDLISYQSGKEVIATNERPDTDLEFFRLGVCGWENMTDENGNEIPFKLEPKAVPPSVHPDLLDMLPLELISDVALQAVWKFNFPSQDTLKNSEGQSSQE